MSAPRSTAFCSESSSTCRSEALPSEARVTWIVARCICRPTAARTVLKVGDPLAPALMRAASGFDNCRTPRKKSLTQIMRANHTSRPHGRHTHRAEAGRQGEGGRRPAVPVGCRGWLRCDLGWLWLCVVPHPQPTPLFLFASCDESDPTYYETLTATQQAVSLSAGGRLRRTATSVASGHCTGRVCW
jgi:hypothetical protein